MDAKKISISVGKRQLEAARKIARRESLSLSGVFMRGLEKETNPNPTISRRHKSAMPATRALPHHEGHTGAKSFVCHDADAACPPVP
ncbi:MAG: hypothetical protein M3O46_08065 [Myxococcota bacterium]|nr:hypothetical protein [Myxococcota bacterium]